MDVPCPKCELIFVGVDELNNHALQEHSTADLADILGGNVRKPLTKENFVQVDSHWLYVVDGFHLSVAPDAKGAFKLTVYGSLEDIPPATQYPTEPEWTVALTLANKFVDAFNLAGRRE